MQRSECVRKIRVLIIDDHPLVRKGIQCLIDQEPDMVVCGESEDTADALAKVVALRPDVASVDLNLGSESGLELVSRMRALGAALKILVLSLHEDRTYHERAAAAGAHAYVSKRAAAEQLVDSIREIMMPGAFRAMPSPQGVTASN